MTTASLLRVITTVVLVVFASSIDVLSQYSFHEIVSTNTSIPSGSGTFTNFFWYLGVWAIAI